MRVTVDDVQFRSGFNGEQGTQSDSDSSGGAARDPLSATDGIGCHVVALFA